MEEKDKDLLIKLAKESILSHFTKEELDLNDYLHLKEKKGVFISLFIGKTLRGRKGILSPVYELYKGVMETALSAAFTDTRFQMIAEKDVPELKVEITIVTPTTKLLGRPDEYADQIEIGKHGLYLVGKEKKGILLPQEATEHDMTKKQFLNAVSQKAGLSFNAWQDEENKLFKFKAETIKED